MVLYRLTSTCEKNAFFPVITQAVLCETSPRELKSCHFLSGLTTDHSTIRMLSPRTLILSVRSTSKPRDQSTKRRSHSENVWKICLVTRLRNYQTWRTHFWEIHEVRKGLWAFFLDCAFRMLIGWATDHVCQSWKFQLLLLKRSLRLGTCFSSPSVKL